MTKDEKNPIEDISMSDANDMMQQLFSQLYYVQTQNIDIANNEVYLFGRDEYYVHGDGEPGIEYSLTNQFIRNFNFLREHVPSLERPILIHLKSCGGYWSEGMAIYDSIKMCNHPTVMINYTHAQSMTSIIYLAADKRVMMPHSTFMIHRGTMGLYGTGTQFKTEMIQLQKTEDEMFDIYVKHLKKHGNKSIRKKTRKAIWSWLDKMMKEHEEVYFSAEEAVEIGWADEIFDGDWERLRKIKG